MLPLSLVLMVQAVAAKPIDAASWVNVYDYPAASLPKHEQGRTGFDLIVMPDGVPWRCDVTTSSGSPLLDQQTCAMVMRRAHLAPATDGDGKPIAAVFSSSVIWALPGHPRPRPLQDPLTDATLTVARLPGGLHAPLVVQTVLLVAATGAIEHCDPGVDAPQALGPVACAQISRSWQAKVAHDPQGVPVRSVQTVRVGFVEAPH
jgi:hypothetical protein